MTRIELSLRLTGPAWILAGTLVKRYLRCRRDGCPICRKQGGHGPAYYLSVRGPEGKTRMVYVPKERLAEARQGVKAYRRLKEGLRRLWAQELRQWRQGTRRTRR
jgi:hypothetical protein